MKRQNGITLIALIITIIVMLILVGVTINVALNGNLFGKAETATRQTEEQAILEEMLAMMDVTNEGKIDYDTIIKKMKEKRGAENVEYAYPNATITGKLGTYNYIVSEAEIKIGSSKSDIDENFEKYIMGADKKGKFLIESDEEGNQIGIINEDTGAFQDDPLTEDVDETQTLGVEFLTIGENEDSTKEFIYAKYDNKAYKITTDTTYKSEKLEMIYEPKGTEGRDLGTVTGNAKYNDWTILYDNGSTVEAVAPFTSDGELTLGSNNVGDAIDSYNKAITIINNYCKNELTGLPTNSNVRSVGASSETSDEASNKYTLPEEWNSTYDGVGKKGDTLYEQDLVRMAYHGVLSTGTSYWMASRVAYETPGIVFFDVNCVDEDGSLNYRNLWNANSSGYAYGSNDSYAVRPIITIQNP